MSTGRKSTLALLGLAALAACGGGGDAAPGAFAYDTNAGWQASLSQSRTYNASGRGSDGKDYAVALAFTPQGPTTYPRTGTAASKVDQRASVSSGGVPLPGFEPLNSLFFVAGFVLIGLAAGGGCSDVSGFFPLPSLAQVNGGAPLFTAVGFPTCTPGGSANGSGSSADWSLQVYSGDVYFCIETTQRNSAGAVSLRQSTCLQIDRRGALGPKVEFRLEIPASGFSLVARGG